MCLMTDLVSVQDALKSRLASQRVVFWHDPADEFAAELDALDLGAVNVIRVEDNEFGVKNILLNDHVLNPVEGYIIYLSIDPCIEYGI